MTVTSLIGMIGTVWFALAMTMFWAWLVQQRTGNSGWVDVFWSLGLGIVGVTLALIPMGGPALTLRQWLVAALVLAWMLRLGSHIASRTRRSSDDPRYAELARQWGPEAPGRMVWLLQGQALATVPLVAAVLVAAYRPGDTLGIQDLIGLALLAIAITGEALADRQLDRFRSDLGNRKRVMDTGLWGWSRHPNYLFQWLGWLAFPVIAIDLSGQYPFGWIAVLAPLAMYGLLVHVSGIPPLEAHMLRSRGAAFRDYQARTSPFFPRPPRPQMGSTP